MTINTDNMPGTPEFKKNVKEFTEKFKKMGPRPQDPFEDDSKYFDYLTAYGYTAAEHMSPEQLKRAAEQTEQHKKNIAEAKARQQQAELEHKMRDAGISELHKVCTFDNYKLENKEQRFYVERLKTEKRGWFMFLGKTGTGKNHLAAAMIKERLIAGQSATIWRVKRLMDTLLGEELAEKKHLLRHLEMVDLLILNELGRSTDKKFFHDTIFDLLDERHENFRQTVIISNLSKEDVFKLFDEPLQRKLSRASIFEFNWPAFGQESELFPVKEENNG